MGGLAKEFKRPIEMTKQRLKIHIQGAVQGVGFRPFIWRLANDLRLTGWVRNTTNGVFIEAEGEKKQLDLFLKSIPLEKPSISKIHSLKSVMLDAIGFPDFKIDKSSVHAAPNAWMLPDIATCPECLAEVVDPKSRRYLYPFTNCTHCGPRFSIIEALPYDRQNTTMKIFTMCRDCEAEYSNPHSRRFHAQPNACPVCGPHVELWDERGNPIEKQQEALERAVHYLAEGLILAVKGLGGFHLLVDATNDDAVQRLRLKKKRDEKPFAVMFPRIEDVAHFCRISSREQQLLNSPESPIVLLCKSDKNHLSEYVAPKNPMLGVMLPYTPLHFILMQKLNRPVVATSGNLADETICTDNTEALSSLGRIADYFLVHNRPIAHHVDDSIVRMMADRPVVLRRARGYAPLPILLNKDVEPSLAVGGHLKNSIVVADKKHVFISQHIGDLETENSITTLQHTISDFEKIYDIKPKHIIHDKHPDYVSTHYAQALRGEKNAVQHHVAHILSCMADNELEPPVLGVSWDGTGFGDDGSIWGGEFFLIDKSVQRVANFRTFPLPGGDMAIKRPYRSAIGLLYEMDHAGLQKHQQLPLFQHCDHEELKTLTGMLEKKINTPRTSSAGRLFDVVASLLDIQHINFFEGQAPMQLEFAAWQAPEETQHLPFEIRQEDGILMFDWQPTIETLLKERNIVPLSNLAARFHNTLVQVILAVANKVGQQKVVLSGGTFQNKFLVERTIKTLTSANFQVYFHQQVPPNDGGIALGQIVSLLYK